jgi:hypothetical protein
MRFSARIAWLAGALVLPGIASAQQKTAVIQTSRAYDVSREVTVQGTVSSFTESASTPPLGAHVVVQAASGPVDVHLGDAKLLQAKHITLSVGDSVRIIGENLPYGNGTQFFARILQKGTQAVALRGVHALPVRPMAQTSSKQGGVL